MYAEAIFTAHQTLASAQEFYADIKHRAKALGRDPGQILVLPGISPFIGSTEADCARTAAPSFHRPAFAYAAPTSEAFAGN